jgi:hypothetical protein
MGIGPFWTCMRSFWTFIGLISQKIELMHQNSQHWNWYIEIRKHFPMTRKVLF